MADYLTTQSWQAPAYEYDWDFNASLSPNAMVDQYNDVGQMSKALSNVRSNLVPVTCQGCTFLCWARHRPREKVIRRLAKFGQYSIISGEEDFFDLQHHHSSSEIYPRQDRTAPGTKSIISTCLPRAEGQAPEGTRAANRRLERQASAARPILRSANGRSSTPSISD